MAGDTAHTPDAPVGTYEAWACPHDHVHVEIKQGEKLIPLVFPDADEAYNFAQAILRAYDDAVGIAPPTEY